MIDSPQTVQQLEQLRAAARSLAAEGRWAEALERHRWFHDHVLEIDESYYGVRLSFALSEWVELGAAYPEALTQLRAVRAEKAGRLLAGELNRRLFHDVASIDRALEDRRATTETFRALGASSPAFAEAVYDIAGPALVLAGEFPLCAQFLGDWRARLERSAHDYLEGLSDADYAPNPEAAIRAHAMIFTDDAVSLIRILRETGQAEAARAAGEMALAVLDVPEIREALGSLPRTMDARPA